MSILSNVSASSNCWVIFQLHCFSFPVRLLPSNYFLVSPLILVYRQSLSNLLLESLFPLHYRLSLQRQGSQRSWPDTCQLCILRVPEQGHLLFNPLCSPSRRLFFSSSCPWQAYTHRFPTEIMYNEQKCSKRFRHSSLWFLISSNHSDLNSLLSCINSVYYYPSRLYFYQTISFSIMANIINTSG